MVRGILTIIVVFSVIAVVCTAEAKPWPEIDPDAYASETRSNEWNPDTIKGADPIPYNMIPVSPADRSQYGKYLSLVDMIDIALRNNPDMGKSWADSKAYAAEYGISRSEYYPFIDGSATGAFGKIQSYLGSRSYGEVSLGLKYLLLDFGGREARVASAKQGLITANWMHNQVVQDVLRDVPKAYYYHVSAKARKGAAQSSLADANTTLAATRTRKDAGVATIADVLQAQASQQQAVVDLESARGAVEITKGQLATAVGWPSNTNFETKDKLGTLPLNHITRNVNKLIEMARSNRPNLNAAMAQVRQKEADLKKAKALSFPKITGGGSVMWRGTRRMQEDIYYGGLQIELPIFHGFQTQNSIRKARDELESARESFKSTDDSVIQDTWSAFYDFRTAEQQLKTSSAVLASARESYKVSLERYKVGAADIVELLNAQAMLAHARAQLVDARMMLYTSYAELLHAVGLTLPYAPARYEGDKG